MQNNTDNLTLRPLKEALLDSTWIQWHSLGTRIDARRPAQAMVDPEALLLLSLTLREDERRLWDILCSWAHNGSRLFSLQRVKNLVKSYPKVTHERLAEFAGRAVNEGKDFRWKRLAGEQSGPAPRDHNLWQSPPFSWQPPALILRLRLGIGVGIAPDLLTFLISLRGEWTSARQISRATGYTVYAVRRLADDMAGANLIARTNSKPVHYRVRLDAWRALLDLPADLPPWRFWHPIYAFAAHLLAAGEYGQWSAHSPYLLSSALRDLFETFQNDLAQSFTDLPDPRQFPGEQFVPAFAALLSRLAEWLPGSV